MKYTVEMRRMAELNKTGDTYIVGLYGTRKGITVFTSTDLEVVLDNARKFVLDITPSDKDWPEVMERKFQADRYPTIEEPEEE